ncbi:CHASE2 domain-containing protein, partial [Candidatus Gracilibacteria bacterium]|nr:CHASE2 domain-containing protein [Candidatus Gracilibacteria bacterium]
EFAKTLKRYKNIVIGATYDSAREDKSTACVNDKGNGMITCKGFPQVTYASVPWGLVDVGSYNSETSIKDNEGAFSRRTQYDIFTKNIAKGSESTPGAWKNNLGLSTELYSLATEMVRLNQPNILTRKEFRNPSIINPYFGAPGTYPSYSMIDVLLSTSTGELERMFRGKYVLIGESGTFIDDKVISPVTNTRMDGVELHAHFLDGLLQDKMLSKVPTNYMMILSILLTIATILCYFFLPRVLSLIFAGAAMLATLWASRYIYDVHRLVIDIFPLFLSVFLATFTMTYFYRFFVVDKEKRYIENAFGHYIDPKMVEMIDMEEVAVSLGGEQRELSVFFSDIAGFTTISEKLSPENLFWLMSLYLSRMTDILKVEGGTLDKYIGDAVMGFFGAPVAQSDHAIRACKTAVAMRKALPELNNLIAERGIMRVDFRIGISSGDVMVGNIGSKEHFNYTVLGDTVNLASRLEATGKEYDVNIIISEGTREKIGERFELRELDTIAVKGKEKGVKIYELLGNIGDVKDKEIYTKYEQALVLYRKGKYIEAGKIWETQMNQDPPSRIMVMRCIEILKGNITVENGIFHMTHK